MIKKRLAQSSALLLLLTFVLMFAPKGAPQSSGPTLKKIAEFDLPGPGGKRFDYLTVDPDDHYLLSAHLAARSEEHTSELQSRLHLVCRLLLEKKKNTTYVTTATRHTPLHFTPIALILFSYLLAQFHYCRPPSRYSTRRLHHAVSWS